MLVYLQAYQPDAVTAAPLLAFVTLYRGSAEAFETTPVEVKEALPNRLRTMPLAFSLALDELPPGEYKCQVTVLDAATWKAAFWQAPIRIVP